MQENKNKTDKHALSVGNSNFYFSNYSCDVLVDTIHDNKGMEHKYLSIKNTSGKYIDFNFTQSLYKKSDYLQEHNILMEFISIASNKVGSLSDFFEANGFILDNSRDEYCRYSCNDLYGIIKRVKCLVELIMELQSSTHTNEKLLENVVYLLLSNPVVFYEDDNLKENNNGEDRKIIYESYHTEINEYINDYWYNQPDGNVPFYYDQEIYAGAYTDITNSKKKPKDILRFSITLNHLFRHDISKKTRNQINFLYKLINISDIEEVNHRDGVVFTKKNQTIISSFDEELKLNLMEIAKDVVKSELDYNIRRIRPSYDKDTLLGSWEIPDLLSAIYFSIFFLNPNFEVIKKCTNPTCANYYSVLHTNSRKKYCCQQCANAVNQRKSRERRKFNDINID